MSYNITLYCGCLVYVACHPQTGVAHTRVLEHRHPLCPVRTHEIGLRLAIWELLPEPQDRTINPAAPGEPYRVVLGTGRLASTFSNEMASQTMATPPTAQGQSTRRA